MNCEICQLLREVEAWNKSWSDEQPVGPVAFNKLSYIRYANGSHIYKCPGCGQLFLYTSWNELFPDGWTEFSKLRKLSPEESNKYPELPEY